MKIDSLKSIEIDKNEVLRYLEYKGQEIDKSLHNIIDECIKITKSIINPRYILRVYPILREENSSNEDKINIEGSNLTLESRDLYNLLNRCNECIIMATTLGIEIEREIKIKSYNELSKSIILDACATTAIEELCNILQLEIEDRLSYNNKFITSRYSPGYGDLSIEKNRDIIDLLNCQREIGLTITESGIMIPRKSVVAIIGISDKAVNKNTKTCLKCSNSSNCKYKKGDDRDECKRFYKK